MPPPRKSADPAWIRIAERTYTAALLLFPRQFREEYGDCLRQAFRDRCREVARGQRNAFRVLALELAPDLVTTLGREQMHAGFGDITPRHTVLVGCLGLAFAGLAYRDAISPVVLDATVATRNRINEYIDLHRIEAGEANTRRIAEGLADAPDAGSKALAALLYRSIAERKEHPYWAPDNQNEAFYHRLPDKADAETTRIRQLVTDVLRDPEAGAYALVRAVESCIPQDGCDRAEAVSRLGHADAGNGYAWTLAFAEADARDDEPARRHALEQLARASRYDTYEAETAQRLARVADAMGLSDDAATATLTRNIIEADLFGEHSVLASDCIRRASAWDADAASEMAADVQAGCHRAFELMAQSSKLGPSLQGWHGLARFTDDAALRSRARVELRDRYWLAGWRFEQDRVYTDVPGDFHSAGERRAWQAAFRRGGGEIPSLRRWFVARGMPAHAPSDYNVADKYLLPTVHLPWLGQASRRAAPTP
jgi:hypothetical protein